MVKVFSWVPAPQATPEIPVTVVPWGPVTVKSQAATLLHNTFSERLKVMEVLPQDGALVKESMVGGTLSKITAVEADKSIVYPAVEVENWLTFIT